MDILSAGMILVAIGFIVVMTIAYRAKSHRGRPDITEPPSQITRYRQSDVRVPPIDEEANRRKSA